jgi:hypothetical protein
MSFEMEVEKISLATSLELLIGVSLILQRSQ